MNFCALRLVRPLAVLAFLCWVSVPASSQRRPVAQPAAVWGAMDVTLYRDSPKYPSLSGNHYLVYQPDGNLVVYTKSGQFVWGLNQVTPNFGAAQRINFANGNIVAYDAGTQIVWQALTAPNTIDRNARPFLTEGGVLQMFYCRTTGSASQGGIFWASDNKTRKGCVGTAESVSAAQPLPIPQPIAQPVTVPPAGGKVVAVAALPGGASLPLKAGNALVREKQYPSPSGHHNLIFAKDGNLIVRRARDSAFIWGVNDQTKDYAKSDRVEMRADGTFAVLDANGGTVWAPPLKRKDRGAALTVSFAGALQVVAPRGEILWSSDGVLTAPLDVTKPAKTTACVPADEGAPEWDKCLKMASPKMILFGSKLATSKAMNAVANVYADLTSRFQANYSKDKLDGFKVYLTNGESAAVLKTLPPAGTMWKGTGQKSSDFLRGGASQDFLWISEQMICKVGVATRNVNPRALGMKDPDYTLRTFDQVIHELGHSIHYRYGIADTSEEWPQAIQRWFAAPVGSPDAAKELLVKDLFKSQASYSCETY